MDDEIMEDPIKIWVVVSKIFYVHPYLGKSSNLTNIFQMDQSSMFREGLIDHHRLFGFFELLGDRWSQNIS